MSNSEKTLTNQKSASQKMENLLNLALDATREERMRSEELEVGYDPGENEWELIVKYSGDLERIREIASSVTGLLNGYAVVVIREERIKQLELEASAAYYRDVILTRMEELRLSCDALETMTSAQHWPFPTYGKLLFGIL